MKHLKYLLEIKLSTKEFVRQVAQNLAQALRQFRELQNQAQFNANVILVSFVPFILSPSSVELDPMSMIAIT
jgi:hypothetical protein